MLKVIPVEEAIGMPLAHDITEIVPGKHKGPAFRRGHIVRKEDISKLLDVGKRHLYVMELEKDELHEEDAARRLAKAAAGPNLKLTDPVEGRVNLVAEISGLLKIDVDRLYRFNSLGDLMMATLPSNRYVRQGDVVAANQPVVRVLRTDDLWVKVYVPETKLARVRLRQPVEVTVDGYAGRSFAGQVRQIAADSEFTPRNVQSVDERRHQVFGVRIRVSQSDDPSERILKSGMAAEVVFSLRP